MIIIAFFSLENQVNRIRIPREGVILTVQTKRHPYRFPSGQADGSDNNFIQHSEVIMSVSVLFLEAIVAVGLASVAAIGILWAGGADW
ncbi:hypothetical protein HMPREF2954_00950 [Neisseria sp. HMSC067H09]|nr:hypothetical protein HMPREF3156_00078 [Neisseria sp. HMSC06F02]OFS04543.1 hypothetical protein HMPREF2954_00950 [Neisseria sp. HMSC067H09]